MKKAFIFPGQGSQFVGMLSDLYVHVKEVKDKILEGEEILKKDITKLMFSDSEENLRQTNNAQPALFLSSAAIMYAIEKNTNNIINYSIDFCAGHSLGEYSALFAAKSLAFDEALRLVTQRGQFMQEECIGSKGGMVACIGLTLKGVENMITKNQFTCEIANDNSESQQVISAEQVDEIISSIKQLGGVAIKLKTSGAFHSKLMQNANENLTKYLLQLNIMPPKLNFIPNILAAPTNSIEEIRKCLIKQMCSRVRWRETIEYLLSQNVKEFIEVGIGGVLTNILKKNKKIAEDKSIHCYAVNDIKSFETLLKNYS